MYLSNSPRPDNLQAPICVHFFSVKAFGRESAAEDFLLFSKHSRLSYQLPFFRPLSAGRPGQEGDGLDRQLSLSRRACALD